MKKNVITFLLVLVFVVCPFAAPSMAAIETPTVDAAIVFFMPVGSSSNPFVHMAEIGIMAGSSLFPGLKIARVYPYSDEYINEYIKFTASRGRHYIVGIGSYYGDAFDKVADSFPNINFIVIDGKSSKKNVKSLVFNNYEAGYLAGVVAAQVTSTGRIGFIGGKETQVIYDFEKGFKDAAKNVSKDINVISKFISKDNDGYSNEKAGFEIASEMYKSGADILFAAAGSSGLGSIDAARASRKMIIGVDTDQDGIAKGLVVTSVIKRLDAAIVNLMQDIATGKYSSDEIVYNVGNVGFTLSSFSFTRDRIGKKKMDRIFDMIFDVKKKYDNSDVSKAGSREGEDSKREGKKEKDYEPGRSFRK